jgi:hypothetical protein
MKRVAIFVHGFGVMKDSRGMFTEIVNALSAEGIESVLVDLNIKDSLGNITVNTFSKQAELLRKTYTENKENEVYLVCHSQGCIIAALANLEGTKKTIFLAPPVESDNSKTIEYFKKNLSTKINLDGESILARRDGTMTIVSSEYWREKEKLNLKSLYSDYVSHNKVVVVKASLDEVISNQLTDEVFKTAEIKEIEADHNFTGLSRVALISLLKKLVTV